MNDSTRILLADDHPLLRRGLRQTIESEPSFVVIAEASNGVEALRQIQELKPQIAVLDVGMPEMGGFAVANEIRRLKSGPDVLFLTMHKDREMFNRAMELGAKAYVLKDSALDEIVYALKSVRRGHPYVSSTLLDFLMQPARHRSPAGAPSLSYLTATERRVLRLIAEYKTSKQISEELHIHYRTVDNHRTNICNKLGLQGSHSLLKFAVEHQSELY